MRAHKLRSVVAACCVAVATAVVAGCGPSEEDAPVVETPPVEITITGTGGEAPTLTYPVPLVLSAPESEVAWEGTGDELVEGGPVLLRVYSEDGTDASVVRDDFAGLPSAHLLTPDAIGSELLDVLSGHTVGTRLLYAAQTDGVPLVSSIDILPTRAVGDVREPDAGMPSVERAADGAPTVTIPADTAPPTTLQAQQVVRGTGEQVASGQQVVVQYVAVKWSTGEVIDTTWGDGRLPRTVQLGADQLIEGVEEGLVDLPVGSQVMLVLPPGQAFGPSDNELSTETLVYVVDILAVSPPTP